MNEDIYNAAMQAVRLLVLAYAKGEKHGGSIEWSDVDLAHEAALDALAYEFIARGKNHE